MLGDKATSAIMGNTKIKRFVPDCRATIPFHEGIRRTLAWFKADPAWMHVVPETNAMMNRIVVACEHSA